MEEAVEAKIVEPGYERPQIRLTHVRALGLVGTVLAILTMLAAFSFGMLILFGTTLISAAVVWFLWPLIFSPQFTQWAFGAEKVSFWKIFLLLLAAGAVVKLFRPLSSKK